TNDAPKAGTPGGPGLAIQSAKILTCATEGRGVVDNGLLLVRDGKIEAVGRARDLAVPEGYEFVDVGQQWLMPGLIDLHCHAGAIESLMVNDLNDGVFLANPGLRALVAAEPENSRLMLSLQAGVTSVLVIPGSGTNVGGQGVLLKTGHDRFEKNLIRNPGSLKVAQWGNPESWGPGVGKSFENWTIGNTFDRGLGYAQRWAEFEKNGGEEPLLDPQWEVFRDLLAKRTQASVHTQMYQVVLQTINQLKGEFGIDVYIDHGSIGAWRVGDIAQEMGVPAILGPRNADTIVRGFINWGQLGAEDVGFRGSAAGYQERGHKLIGFNTDSPVIPQQELQLQAGMAVRYGMDDSGMETVRGLTINPAIAAGIAHRVGSLEPGKDADVVVISGPPGDPRSWVERVWLDGVNVYNSNTEHRRW
ncbi:MAG: hypothetical protein ACI8TX_003653, partial [Hyphomicrobiaceae bacterium]